MIEEDILCDENSLELLKLLFEDGVIDKYDERCYKINYFGERTDEYLKLLLKYYLKEDDNLDELSKVLINKNDERNFIIFVKYKNIYIGGLSIFDFQNREGFGLNKYLINKESFYIGNWKRNKKYGIGFLKIYNNHLLFGNFKENQINDDGFYHNKDNGNLFFGLFNNGKFIEGFYYNLNKEIYYIGNFINNKKNDDFSFYINYKNQKVFIGEMKNDIFIKGYIFILKIEETKNDIISKIKSIIYKNNDNSFSNISKKNKNLNNFVYFIIKTINKLKEIFKNVKILLSELENIYDDNVYNNRIGRYNSIENSFSFENDLINNYNKYSKILIDIKREINIQNIKNKIII